MRLLRYTVKQVSALTGIGPDRLRAWERRYGVVSPARSESRYRLYDDADLARLRMMVELVDSGTSASLAAQQVRPTHADPTISAASTPSPGSDGRPYATSSSTADLSALPSVDALVSPARSLDRSEVEQLLDRAFAAGSFESVMEHWLLPALNALGQAWAEGGIDVAGEHFVSGAVRGRLNRAFDAAGTALDGPVVLVGLPPGALHGSGRSPSPSACVGSVQTCAGSAVTYRSRAGPMR